MEKTLLYSVGNKMLSKPIMVYKDVSSMNVLSNPVAWKIMQLLSAEPKYTAQVARELRIYEQSAYYYMQKLLRIGAIRQSGTRTIRGGTARLYKTVNPSYGLEMDWGESDFSGLSNSNRREMKNFVFFKEFIRDNLFNGLIVVGAPDPHGPYKSSARDGHYAIQLAFSLGNLCSISDEFIVKLDSDARAERAIDGRNVVSIGGPGTNIVTAEFNKYMPIKFNESNFWSGLAAETGELYNMDNHGLIAKIRNPYDDKNTVIIVAGVRSIGTKSAVLGLTNFATQTLRNYVEGHEWAIVVQGFDMNADGKIDHVDIIKEISR
ncbi:MAG TPA: hypothetical protein VE130_00250 [Nitrososphaeraceae archaeon]|nr:hypothetical protein [Nitrososphaeraceae archaeon]